MRDVIRPALAMMFAMLMWCGCQSFNSGKGGEPAAAEDKAPPADYHPLYVRNVQPVASTGTIASDNKLSVGRIDANDPNRTRMYVHLVDTNGNYLSGATAARMKGIWCGIEDRFNGKVTRPKFTVNEVTENDREPHAIAIVMDHSGSMGEERALAVQNAVDHLIDRKKPDDAFALVKYDNKIGVEAPLSRDNMDLHSRLKKNGLTGYGNLTAITDGIAAGIAQVSGARNFRQRAVVIFTDGQDNSSTISRDSIIGLAKRSNTIINAVDFGYGVNEEFLRGIAEATGGIYSRMYSTNEFDVIFDDVYRRLHNYYLIEYTPQEFGVHEIRLKMCLPNNDTLIATAAYDNTPYVGVASLVDVNFDVNKSDILPQTMPAVQNVVTLMRAFPAMTIELRGHTDSTNSTGDSDYNMKLSQRRADAVRKALIDRGIDASRIRSVGLGDRYPIADNVSEEGRARNRRTEFVILSK